MFSATGIQVVRHVPCWVIGGCLVTLTQYIAYLIPARLVTVLLAELLRGFPVQVISWIKCWMSARFRAPYPLAFSHFRTFRDLYTVHSPFTTTDRYGDCIKPSYT